MNSYFSKFHQNIISFKRKITKRNIEKLTSINNSLMNKNIYDAESDKYKTLIE